MDIIIKKIRPKGRTRSKLETELSKEGWGTSLDEERIDQCRHLEEKVKEKYGADKSFFKNYHIKDVD